ncbi:hypothetical protein MUP95_09635, partial [bacterium]|nr:hypothetical protein [bacterium]
SGNPYNVFWDFHSNPEPFKFCLAGKGALHPGQLLAFLLTDFLHSWQGNKAIVFILFLLQSKRWFSVLIFYLLDYDLFHSSFDQ